MTLRPSLAFIVAASAIPMIAASQTADIYPAPEAATKQIAQALEKAKTSHARVILDFGGNWCGDCRALDKYCQEAPNDKLIADHFVIVHVNIGKFDKNLDIAKRYQVPLEKGVPALAVLDSKGRVLFSQKKGEFEAMRSMSPDALTQFLNRWKG